MESRHCPYLALPNMVSELMLDSISFFQLYRGSAISEPIGMNLSQRMESEPSRFYKSLFVHRLGPTRPYCPVRKVYHDRFARPIEDPHVGPTEPNARADLSHTSIVIVLRLPFSDLLPSDASQVYLVTITSSCRRKLS